jgi:hypothetical protein
VLQGLEQHFWKGTEAGRMGCYDFPGETWAGDGSANKGVMGAGRRNGARSLLFHDHFALVKKIAFFSFSQPNLENIKKISYQCRRIFEMVFMC